MNNIEKTFIVDRCEICKKGLNRNDARLIYVNDDKTGFLSFCIAHEGNEQIREILKI